MNRDRLLDLSTSHSLTVNEGLSKFIPWDMFLDRGIELNQIP